MNARGGGAGRRRLITEEIVNNLRPWSGTEKTILEGVINAQDKLQDTVVTARDNVLHSLKSKKAAEQLQPALKKLINILRRFPADHPLFKELDSSSNELSRQFEHLRDTCDHPTHFKLPKKMQISQRISAHFLPAELFPHSQKGRRRVRKTVL
jgi:hypothetical protein